MQTLDMICYTCGWTGEREDAIEHVRKCRAESFTYTESEKAMVVYEERARKERLRRHA